MTQGKRETWHQNPFYDNMFGVRGRSIPTKRVGYKIDEDGQLQVTQLPRGTRDFERDIKRILADCPPKEWPYDSRLLIAISIHLTETEHQCKDVDNLAKSLLDAMKGTVYRDDAQIDALYIVKAISRSPSWMIGIRRLDDDPHPWYLPTLCRPDHPFEEVQTYKVIARKRAK